MQEDVTNIVFGRLADRVLGDALQQLGRSEGIILFPDDLSVGPLRPLDGALREGWMRANLRLAPQEWGVFPFLLDGFVEQLQSRTGKIVCWFCRNSVYELCGFYECVRRIGDRLFFIDTMTATQFEYDNQPAVGFPPRLAHVSPLVAARLIGNEVSVSTSLRAAQQQIWRELSSENAPLRTMDAEGVKSASLSHFDPFLIAVADRKWQAARWVVTQAAIEANNDNFFRVDMMTLTGRLHALVEEGRLQADRDITDREVNVRIAKCR
jgi:hypothetical protein